MSSVREYEEARRRERERLERVRRVLADPSRWKREQADLFDSCDADPYVFDPCPRESVLRRGVRLCTHCGCAEDPVDVFSPREYRRRKAAIYRHLTDGTFSWYVNDSNYGGAETAEAALEALDEAIKYLEWERDEGEE